MRIHFTPLCAIPLLTVISMLISACSSTPEHTKKDVLTKDVLAYYPEMNDSIAMSIIFHPLLMDTTYITAGPSLGEIADIKARWAWVASIDSVKSRYPETEALLDANERVTVFYEPFDSNITTKSKETYEMYYKAKPSSQQRNEIDLGETMGFATFSKTPQGWHLKKNIYNVNVREQLAAAKASGESANERMFTLRWSNDTNLGGGMVCATQSYQSATIFGSKILTVPTGQVWLPVMGKSKPSFDSSLSANIQIESDDERPDKACYFGLLRKLPSNVGKNIARAKDEFHKYYVGTRIRFWGIGKVNEVNILVTGPGPLPSGSERIFKKKVAIDVSEIVASSPHPAPTVESPVAAVPVEASLTQASKPNVSGLFGAPGAVQEFSGNVGKLKTHYNLTLEDNHILTGSYYYDKHPSKLYTLKGKIFDNGNVKLTEYTGQAESATCYLNLIDKCYTGKMQNADGRAFEMTVCR